MNRQLCVGIWLLALVPFARAASVPNPTVIGPIPANAIPDDASHDYPFFSANVDLASRGYVEEEFFFEGAANRYNTPPLTTGSVIDSDHWYRTRMVVRRPASPAAFNGTVVLEWLNVSAGYDFDSGWEASYEHFIRHGYAWVGVSTQRVGIHQLVTGLKAWSPARYGTLDVTERNTILNDALSYDIFSQAAQAVRSPAGVDPMAGLHVSRVIAAGGSQSANRLVIYHNSIHPLAGVFDGFILSGTAGGAVLLRTDLDVRVFKLLSETDVATLSQAAYRQPDSDHLRTWEVAGAAHLDLHLVEELVTLATRDGIPLPSASCNLPPLSRIPFHFVRNAVLDQMVDWLQQKTEPPTAPQIELVTLGPPIVVARDTLGNALGGIRLSQHAVPTATNTGLNSGSSFCPLFGSFQPFDAATLEAIYPDHGTYVSRVAQAARRNVADGYVLMEDAIAAIRDAASADVGKP